MSDSILVRITLDSYDFAHPSETQTQVYVQIPEVARVSYMLPAARFHGLKDRAWPEVLDVAQEHYAQGWVFDPSSAVARQAVMEWLRDPTNRDEMQAAYEDDQTRRHPVTQELRAQVAELQAERHSTNEALSDAAEALRANRDRIAELEAELAQPDAITRRIAPTQALSDAEGEPGVPRTERSYWVDIAAALNAAEAAGMPVCIDLDGTLTDHNTWSVVWDRTAEQWTVAGYDDDTEGGACTKCGDAPRKWCKGCAKCSCVAEHDAGCPEAGDA